MQKSIIERVFPRPRKPLLPQYDEPAADYHDDELLSPRPMTHIRLSSNVSHTSASRSSRQSSEHRPQSNSESQFQAAPASASIVHHDDPFLAVDRAAATLQQTIQSLLDAQSQVLGGRHQDDGDTASIPRTPSPTLSRTSYSTSTTAGVVPVRQPKSKKTTLRVARRGLLKSMRDFATLKEQELKITKDETASRETGLKVASEISNKKAAVQQRMQLLQERASGNEAAGLRSEAHSIEQEIHELEIRLLELKARQRRLIDQATQIENTAASELSSFKGSLSLIEKETKAFLRHPPVKQSLSPRTSIQHAQVDDMYHLRPERRTLNLATEQWTGEIDLLAKHETDVCREMEALLQGATMWKEVLQRVDEFENLMRSKMKAANSDSTADIVAEMDSTTRSLHEKFVEAGSKDWTLLVCAIGAELEAFRQARAILRPDDPPLELVAPAHLPRQANRLDRSNYDHDEDCDVPSADLLSAESPELQPNPSSLDASSTNAHDLPSPDASNESLKATLREFPHHQQTTSMTLLTSKAQSPPLDSRHLRSASASTNLHVAQRPSTRHSESEDDDPGPDFFLSN